MKNDLKITPENIYNNRREFLKLGAGSVVALSSVKSMLLASESNLDITDYNKAINYPNFYEFSTHKATAVKLAQKFQPKEWNISISGEIEKPINLNLNDISKFKQYSRVYRFRCVEAWSMVVPWNGIELRELIEFVRPTSKAQYVKFVTLYDKNIFPDQSSLYPTIPYPYVEVLRLDEAMHPLTMLATGMYDKSLLPQNGAPIRLVVPWKYGFKSIKSIVKIEFIENRIKGTWEQVAPNEYGFYANVNPDVSHPRWSQARELPLGKFSKKPTLLFNGYEKEVANLYAGLDLKKNY